MSDLGKRVLSLAGYLFAALLLVFTGLQTYALLLEVSGSQLTAVLGLVLFEGGMLYWWSVFRREAEGLPQMAISVVMFGLSLVLVAAAVSMHLGAVGADFLGEETPARVIVIAMLLNLIAKMIYPLAHPDKFEEINDRAREGKLLSKVEKLADKKIDETANALAEELAQARADRVRARFHSDYTTRINRRLPLDAEKEGPAVEVYSLAAHPNGHSAGAER